jgi:hypothetical protein
MPFDADGTIQKATYTAYQNFLESRGVAATALYTPISEQEISAGAGNSSDMFKTNEVMFSCADAAPGNMLFSARYKDFLVDLKNSN